MRMNLQCIGRCLPLFLAAVFLDAVGLIVLFVGIFANVRLNGRFYGDWLIYSGSITIFASLASWLMWYIGNIEVSIDDEDEDSSSLKYSSFVQMARKLSHSITKSIKSNGTCAKLPVDEEDYNGHMDPPAARKGSRVTWGKSNAYLNEGYEHGVDSLPPENIDKSPELTSQDDSISTLTDSIDSSTLISLAMDRIGRPPGGRCAVCLVVAVMFDVAGLSLFFLGIFAPFSFWDFFVLSGPLLVFLSLVFWILWYLGGLSVSYEELGLPK